MRTCKINNTIVGCELIGVDAHSFGKPLRSADAISYELELGIDEIIERFKDYYDDFIRRESLDEGDDDRLDGSYLSLRQAGFPPLRELLLKYPLLSQRLLVEELPVEFMGYMFHGGEVSSRKYILQTLVSLDVLAKGVRCVGWAFLNPLFK